MGRPWRSRLHKQALEIGTISFQVGQDQSQSRSAEYTIETPSHFRHPMLPSAAELLKAAKSYDSRVSVDSGNFSAQVATHALANSNGIELKERASVFSWSIM